MARFVAILLLSAFIIFGNVVSSKTDTTRVKYDPNYESLNKRPYPEWFDDANVGIAFHWGLYSVPSFGSDWFWYSLQEGEKSYVDFIKKNYPPNFTYQNFARDFSGELFNATQWALLCEESGARHVVMTAKHHDGFALWPSSRSFGWNAKDVGPKIDVLGQLSTAIREKTSLRFGLYYNMYEWYNRLYEQDKLKNFKENKYMQDKVLPELYEMVELYNPDYVLTISNYVSPKSYSNINDFIAWLFNESQVRDKVVMKQSGSDLIDQKIASMTKLDKTSWGQRFDSNIDDYKTSKDLIEEIVTAVSQGENIILNVGPTKYGTIQPIIQERLRDVGKWLRINGEAIYGSKPWLHKTDPNNPRVRYTKSKDGSIVYAIVMEYPYDTNKIDLKAIKNVIDESTKISLLGMENTTCIQWSLTESDVGIKFPGKHLVDKHHLDLAWTFKISKQ